MQSSIRCCCDFESLAIGADRSRESEVAVVTAKLLIVAARLAIVSVEPAVPRAMPLAPPNSLPSTPLRTRVPPSVSEGLPTARVSMVVPDASAEPASAFAAVVVVWVTVVFPLGESVMLEPVTDAAELAEVKVRVLTLDVALVATAAVTPSAG